MESVSKNTIFGLKMIVKSRLKRKGQKFFQLHRFLNTFLQLAAEKKYSKKGAAVNFFRPFYFVTALEEIFLKFFHAGDYFFLLHKSVQDHNFSNKNNHLPTWRDFKINLPRPLFTIVFHF